MSESNKINWEGETGERVPLERRAATIRNLMRSGIDDRVIHEVIRGNYRGNLGTLECYDEKIGEDKGFPKTGDEEKKK